MRKHTLSLIVVLLALVASSFAGPPAGKLMPAGGPLFGGIEVGATSLKVAAIAPLTSVVTGTGFTYQGRLQDGISPARGAHDFRFTLYDALTGGTQVGGLVQVTQTPSEGLFTVILDFGASAFTGAARYLEIAVRPADVGGFTTLTPRQPITPAPYALYALKTKGYKNMVVVSPDGGDFTSVQAALDSITDNASTNKYLIWVGPGTYTERVTMKPWVDIEGAGEQVTRITFTGSPDFSTGTVVGVSNAALRALTVENTGGSAYATALYNLGASPSLVQVSLTASGGTSSTYGVFNTFGSPTMTNVTAMASGASPNNVAIVNEAGSFPSMNNVAITASGGIAGYGVRNFGGASPIMNNVTVTSSGSGESYGVRNDAASSNMNNVTVTSSSSGDSYGVAIVGFGTLTINNSVIIGDDHTLFANGPQANIRVGASWLNGGPIYGTVTCAGVYDENYAFFASTCP